MILVGRQFPEFDTPGYDIDSPCPIYGWPTAVLYAAATQHEYPDHQTALTLVTNFNGAARYTSKGYELLLQEGEHKLYYPGERFASVIDSALPVDSLYVVFRDQDVIGALSRDLDEPSAGAKSGLYHHSQSDGQHQNIQQQLSALRNKVASGIESEGVEEHVYVLLGLATAGFRNEMNTRPSTVVERRRRLEIAREQIHGELSSELTLDNLASTACLSTFHFLRLFRSTFGVTPHQYILETRLIKARDLLQTTDEHVSEVANKVGFESATTFSAKFKARFGYTPTSARLTRI